MNKELQFLIYNTPEELEEKVVVSILETTTEHGAIVGKTQKISSDFEKQVKKLLKKGGGKNE